MRCPHTHFTPGKRLRIKLRGGEILIRRFVRREPKSILVEDCERGNLREIPTKNLLNVSIFKLEGQR